MDVPGELPPLAASVLSAQAAEAYSFHMPGHKGGTGADTRLRALLGDGVLAADLSELSGFDYLHAPEGPLVSAQAAAADLFGAHTTHFLVNGATVGNVAAIASVAGDGDEVLVYRGSHRSVFAGLVVSGARPVYIEAADHPVLGGQFAPDLGQARAQLDAHPGIRAIHLTRPSYYGLCCDLAPYAELAHERGVPLVVDEAHGTQYRFHGGFPVPALDAGADLVVQSPHKTLSSLTQSSLLHVSHGAVTGGRVVPARVAQWLGMLQSSSPSALLLVSLELACQQMADGGEGLWGAVVELARRARERLTAVPGLWCPGDEVVGTGGVAAVDPTKLVVDVSGTGTTGFAAAEHLARESGVRPEFADLSRVVCSVTIGDTDASVGHLVAAFERLAATRSGARPASVPPAVHGLPDRALTPREAAQRPSEAVALVRTAADGRVAAEFVIPYPPGIPLLVPGERVSAAAVAAVAELRAAGCRIVGPADASLRTLRVLAG